MGKQKNVRYGRQSIVRFEWPGKRVSPREMTVQRLLSTEYAASNLECELTVISEDLNKLIKRPPQTKRELCASLKDLLQVLRVKFRQYRKDSVNDSIGCECRITVIPKEVDVGREAA